MEILNQGRERNYHNARNEIMKLVGNPPTHSVILKIHSFVTGTDDGYRTGFGAPPIRRNGIKVFLPPDSYSLPISQEMDKLLAWYNNNKLVLSPEVLAAKFHWGFVKIHPFDDGNGRTVRLLTTLILYKNYTDEKLKAFEQYFEENKSEYYKALDNGICLYNGFEKVSLEWEKYFIKIIQDLDL